MISLPSPLPQYYKEVAKLRKTTPCLREGQAHMVVLSRDHPNLYREITSGPDDPFYDDRKMGRFKSRLIKLCHPPSYSESDDDEDNTITINLNLSWPFL